MGKGARHQRTAVIQPSLINRFYSSFVLPTFYGDRYRGLNAYWREFERRERMSLEENQALQWNAAQAICEHAYKTVPFYKRRFDAAGIVPSAMRGANDLRALPPLRRQDITENLDDLWSRDFERTALFSATSGGTTDSPVQILRDADCIRTRTAAQLRLNAWAGALSGDRSWWLWGAQTDFAVQHPLRRMQERYGMRRIFAPSTVLTEATLAEFRHQIEDFKPRVIFGYPSALAHFAEYLLAGQGLRHYPVAAVCTAEPLTEEQRDVIEKALGCRLQEQYGSREFGMVAASCEASRDLHVVPSSVLVEFEPVPGGEDEQLHEMYVTCLLNRGMPLLRYKINDCAIPRASGACACGRGYPQIASLAGRVTDTFVLANGVVVPTTALPGRIVKVCPEIAKIQIIQETYSDFLVKYVPGQGFAPSILETLSVRLREQLPATDVQIRFEHVQEIPRERSGKTRMCISRVPRTRPGVACAH
jgi:phenylacetate-CoA ligase